MPITDNTIREINNYAFKSVDYGTALVDVLNSNCKCATDKHTQLLRDLIIEKINSNLNNGIAKIQEITTSLQQTGGGMLEDLKKALEDTKEKEGKANISDNTLQSDFQKTLNEIQNKVKDQITMYLGILKARLTELQGLLKDLILKLGEKAGVSGVSLGQFQSQLNTILGTLQLPAEELKEIVKTVGGPEPPASSAPARGSRPTPSSMCDPN